MISGLHALIYAKDAEAVRRFFRDTLQFPSVDAGDGWLLFALPPAELGIHPTDQDSSFDLYLMCADIEKTVSQLKKRGVRFVRPIHNAGWGRVTAIALPGGPDIGLYQPQHPTALQLPQRKKPASRKRR